MINKEKKIKRQKWMPDKLVKNNDTLIDKIIFLLDFKSYSQIFVLYYSLSNFLWIPETIIIGNLVQTNQKLCTNRYS